MPSTRPWPSTGLVLRVVRGSIGRISQWCARQVDQGGHLDDRLAIRNIGRLWR